jgi:signal peptidase I
LREGPSKETGLLIASAGFSLALGILFIFADRSLAASGATRDRAWPWIAVTALVTLPLFFFQPFLNPTGSMEDTLLVGDHFFVQRFPRPNVTRGDIIAFLYPVDPKQTFIKRIVGIPGDRIRIVNKVLYRNGERLNEPWVSHKLDYIDSYRDGFPREPNTVLFPPAQTMLAHHVVDGEVVVPAGNYFVLGDNRDQSLDSRYWGFVPFANVIGKPVLIYDSVEETTQPPARHIRWNRLFRLL